jgi:histidinol-phosphate phosphatase family protein
MLDLKKIDRTWTLFLDRDGVINHEKVEDYIYHFDEFVFYDGVLEALAILNNIFGRIILVTNQKGIGKGLMTESDLLEIHTKMKEQIDNAGGRLDAIYYASALDNNDPMRKPNPGMAFRAKNEYPEIAFQKAIMVGNNISDMDFGRNAGMHTVFLTTTKPNTPLPHAGIDLDFNSLLNFARTIAPE